MSGINFKPVDSKKDFIKMEKDLLSLWDKKAIVGKYLERNSKAKKQFSFLDGPITANNPMGVHHAWGRTYKDLWQRFYNMKGYRQRFQNGFDEQGLWVEVEVEKELGFKNKKDIEKFGIDKFVDLCKERVAKYAQIQTDQSKRLGYFMDWENSYHTSSDANNYEIWNFIRVVDDKGWLYKGRDSVPWCPRCGTAISQHEILTEEYKEITHKALFVKYPLTSQEDKFLLVWTTTPWTLPSNVAIAVNPEMVYGEWKTENGTVILAVSLAGALGIKTSPKRKFKGDNLIGLKYQGLFDGLPALKGVKHRVVGDVDLVTAEGGTGLVHIAPGAGEEDFKLAKKEGLPVVESIDESASYIKGFGDLTGQNAKANPDLIIDKVKEKGALFRAEDYSHRYPVCWRCKSELVWRVVDEWYIAMDKIDGSGKSYREQMMAVAQKINWLPKWGLGRELDWLSNMHDWLISKKRYWGLALPIWECKECGNFDVIASKEELKDRAVAGWDKFEGHTPHRPWVDWVKIRCSKCGATSSRIRDVGNPWLDAGIVPFSTMPPDWFPADFITESFPGQFKNWFYSLIAMSTALTDPLQNPFKNVLGFATMVDEKGEAFHKSKGNAIEFVEGADAVGADIVRWMCAVQNPEVDLLFGVNTADDVRRRFYLILWNCYKFFTDYAALSAWQYKDKDNSKSILDQWILTKLAQLISLVNHNLSLYDATLAARSIESFVVDDFSTWYIRRSRDRVGPASDKNEKDDALSTMYRVLVTLSKLVAPFMPFVADEIYRNLTGEESVHLSPYPEITKRGVDQKLIEHMDKARAVVEAGHAKRKLDGVKVRVPVKKLQIEADGDFSRVPNEIWDIVLDELNAKNLAIGSSIKYPHKFVEVSEKDLSAEGEAREIIRQIQQLRKEAGCSLSAKIKVALPSWPEKFTEEIKKQTLASELLKGAKLTIRQV